MTVTAPTSMEAEILRRLRSGETQRSVGRAFDLNPVSVGVIAKRAGMTYPEAVASARARRAQRHQQPEASFQRQVVGLAEWCHWRLYHTWLSRHSVAGFPDLVLVRDGRVIFAELKREDGIVQPAQEAWLAALSACSGVETYLWRPSDWQTIERVLA